MNKIPNIPSRETIIRAASEFQLRLNDTQVAQIQQYMAILLAWNEKVNLTAIRDPLEILYRHFCESMFATAVVTILKGRVADVGSGGGFPGLPLKIVKPELDVILIESNVKKATFLAEVARDLRLTEVRILVSRFEDLGEEITPLDYVCSRALGDFSVFLHWARSPQVSAKNAILWIGERDLAEIRMVPGWSWDNPISVPQSLRRLLLVGTPTMAPAAP